MLSAPKARVLLTSQSRLASLLTSPVGQRQMSSTAPAGKFIIKTINAISPVGLAQFPAELYSISKAADSPEVAHAILLRSHKMQDADVNVTCRAIARCGAGTNNCAVDRMTELGIPVFNTPGANANAVKELVLCALLLSSRGIIGGIEKMKELHASGEAHAQIEKVKANYGGRELTGRTLGVVGLGAIGASVCEAALELGMKVIGYDPALSVEAALRLPGADSLEIADELRSLMAKADYISIHAPYMAETKHLIGEPEIAAMKKDASILNFARAELVDSDALAHKFEGGSTGSYVCDFALPECLWKLPNVISIPHLGASTEEAEENAAAMAAATIRSFLETGTVKNSVNFPTTSLPPRGDAVQRICIVNRNKPGMLGEIMSLFGKAKINILQQMNASRGEVAYNVIDVAKPVDDVDPASLTYKSWEDLQLALTSIEGVISTRYIDGTAGSGFAIMHEGKVLGLSGDADIAGLTYAKSS